VITLNGYDPHAAAAANAEYHQGQYQVRGDQARGQAHGAVAMNGEVEMEFGQNGHSAGHARQHLSEADRLDGRADGKGNEARNVRNA
jgi:hypothetical protein